eukprot:COSAG01_NODE_49371_length_372_cov_7.252747_1_plen_90_part_01
MCLLLSCYFDCCLLWHPAYSINSNSQAGRIGGGRQAGCWMAGRRRRPGRGRRPCCLLAAPPGCLGGWLRLVAQPMAVAALPDALLPSLLA